MAMVSVTSDGVSKTVAAGQVPAAQLVTTGSVVNGVARISIPALNQKFSAGDNVTIKGGEVITTSLE
jgi:hypothetical protein